MKCAGAIMGRTGQCANWFSKRPKIAGLGRSDPRSGRAKIGDATIARQARGGVAIWLPPKTTPPRWPLVARLRRLLWPWWTIRSPWPLTRQRSNLVGCPGGKVEIPVKVDASWQFQRKSDTRHCRLCRRA